MLTHDGVDTSVGRPICRAAHASKPPTIPLLGATGPSGRYGVAAPTDEDGEEKQRTVALLRAVLDEAALAVAIAMGRTLPQAEAVRIAVE
jgi:hypothetical protein